MALALCLLLDSRGDRLVRGLWQRLEDQGVATLLSHTHGNHVPHLSYAVLREWQEEAVVEAASALGSQGPASIAVQGSVVFPRGRVALACALEPDLARRQERAARAMVAAGAELHRHYARGRWVPHVSVATSATAAQLPIVVNAVSDVLPLTLRAGRAALIDTSTGRRRLLESLP